MRRGARAPVVTAFSGESMIEDCGGPGGYARVLDGRGAFRRFKDEVARMGLSQDWYAFRDDARASFARDFLEEHGVRWE